LTFVLQLGRSLPGSITDWLDGDGSFAPQTSTTPGNIQRSTDPVPGALRTRLTSLPLPELHRNFDDEDEPSRMSSSQVDVGQRNSAVRRVSFADEPSEPGSSERIEESRRRLGGSSQQGSDKEGRRSLLAPSYRTRSISVL
jgi:hypothetical protein